MPKFSKNALHEDPMQAVEIDPETGCWNWTASLASGYGRLLVGGRLVGSHRFMYEQHVGPIPDGFQIDHLCRNPRCCNPNHLEAVTAKTNVNRGRKARLTDRQRSEIARSNEQIGVLARRYGVSKSYVQKLRYAARREAGIPAKRYARGPRPRYEL